MYENVRTAVREHWFEDFVKVNAVKYSPLSSEDDSASSSSDGTDDIPSFWY